MARVLAICDDLMFGSKVVSMLEGSGHEVELVAAGAVVRERLATDGVDLLVADLTTAVDERVALLTELRAGDKLGGARTLAFYSHVEGDTRKAAIAAGIDLVVPRSRMAREGPALVDTLLGH